MKTDRGIIDKLGNRILPITTPVTSKVDSIPLEGNPKINGKTVESLLLKELETDSTDNNKATFMGVVGRLDMCKQYKPKHTVKAFEFTTCDITKWDILLELIKERYNILKGEV
ncbi:hypothetical protein DF185_00695 [Marinifilum breve]|uniref:Uncharacterized protein n=1 Tax=Marinifilum breve TaxID=2184082 RepID=A0A2V4A1V1_9BACT|nr:hypothetical protein [Marinifilum breve]PXY02646.1 hypothetical protein DF185_00695 [Marinifilum breve]